MKGEIMIFERQLLSLTLIEKELYRLYTNLSKTVEDVAVKTLFSYIATDSLKHSKILVKVFEEVEGSKVREKHCDVSILHTKKLIKKISNSVKKSETINLKELMPLIDTLVGFENLLLNEYKKAFHLEYTGFSEHEFNEPQESDLNIFTLIVGDEELHQRILLAVITLCDRKLSFKKNAPIFKYQNPDSWYHPPRGRRS